MEARIFGWIRFKFARLGDVAQRAATLLPLQSTIVELHCRGDAGASMPTSVVLPYKGLSAALERCQLAIGAGELHGMVAGFRALRHSEPVDSWLALFSLECDEVQSAERLLAALASTTAAQLADPAMGFAPLMPSENSSVAQRARALVAFCRGFLTGVGLAGGGAEMSAEAEEALTDLGRIAASREQFDGENDEASLVELQEFVRVAVLLLFEEGQGRDAAPAGKA